MSRSTKRLRRADPRVGGLTLLRDAILARRRHLDLDPPIAKTKPAYVASTPDRQRLAWLRQRLRTEEMPTRERQRLERLEESLAAKLEG
jgi:hypothetical protein